MADIFTPFRHDNTEGYTAAQCAALNTEFVTRRAAGDWVQLDDDEAAQAFCDEVARR